MEAARLDGAGLFTRIFKIQLPLISPTILYVMCTNLVLAMMCSAPMIIITQGGPSRSTTSLMYLMFASGYGSSNYSLAAGGEHSDLPAYLRVYRGCVHV